MASNITWRAVDQDGEVVDVFLQKRRDSEAAKRFFKKSLKTHRNEPRKIVTDKLRSYGVAHRELIPDSIHDNSQYANNRAELFHQPTRVRGRGMRRFKLIVQAQRFLGVHAAVYNLFNLGCHLISAKSYRQLRQRAQTFETGEPLRLGADDAEHVEVKRLRTINSQPSSKMVAFVRRSVRFGPISGATLQAVAAQSQCRSVSCV